MNEMITVCHSLNNNTCTGLVTSLCLNANRLISLIPRMASNFRHLLSCGTIEQACLIDHQSQVWTYKAIDQACDVTC